jgi:dihydroorotase
MCYKPTTWRIVEARLALEEGWVEGDLWVKDGRIAAIGRLPDKAYGPLYWAKGAFLLPGLIDTHVHFREPGFPEKGTFYTESRAALASGVTTVFDMPNTHPPTTTRQALLEKKARLACRAWTNFALYFGATPIISARSRSSRLGRCPASRSS